MLCSICNETLIAGEPRAHGPDGRSHARCAKLAQSQGTELTLMGLYQEIGKLKARVQDLEGDVEEQAAELLQLRVNHGPIGGYGGERP